MKWQAKHTSLVVIAVGFAVIYLIFRKEWMLTPIGACFIGFLIGPVGDFTHIIWMQLAKVLGYINSRIILSVLFFLLLSPLAFFRKLFQRKQATPQSLKSFFTTRNHVFTKEDLQAPW